MIEQMELIPVIKHIPTWLAIHFNNANAGNYRDKHLFYERIKSKVLEKYADKSGYDLQIIEHKCWSCYGTGTYKHYHYEFGQRFLIKEEPCYKCKNGIYLTRRIILKKYVLNGIIYHIPKPDIALTEARYTNVIKGLVQHEEIEPDKAYISFLVLCSVYDKQLLTDIAIRKIKEKKPRFITLIQSLLNRKEITEDLPF